MLRDTPPKIGLPRLLLGQLRHPEKLRIVLCVTILACWYAAFYGPLVERMTTTQARIDRERKRIASAQRIDDLHKTLAAYKDRIPASSDLNELIQYVMSRGRTSPLKLIDLKPEKTRSLGPYEALALRLTFEGTYAEIDGLLAWIRDDRRLLRIDSLGLAPVARGPGQDRAREKSDLKLNIQLTLTSLVERTDAEKKPG
jgi:Tfp pilus assembly protein PilO